MTYGGNTACLEIRVPSGEIIIIDGGTGVLPLGRALMLEAAGESLDIHLLLTHFHWDHIQGIPFFQPLFSQDNMVKIYSMYPPGTARAVLKGQMSVPYSPMDFDNLPAKLEFVDVLKGEIHLGGARITSFPLYHPQGCSGYRLEYGTSVVVVASDLEHGMPFYDCKLIEAAQDADVLVFDAQFTPEEYEVRRGWGHSTWLEATRVARLAGVKRLVLFHHAPEHDDLALGKILIEARQEFPETSIASEGQTILC
jgi:phosphoribosyl 1,2-cyclic phosphodiesterase